MEFMLGTRVRAGNAEGVDFSKPLNGWVSDWLFPRTSETAAVTSDKRIRITVTGVQGNLASQLVRALHADGLGGAACDWVLSDLGAPEALLAETGAAFEEVDLADIASVRRLVAKSRPDAVLHFGSLLSGASEADLSKAWTVNASASLALMEAAAQQPHCRFLFPSTGATYGAGVPDPLPEDQPQWPANFYGVAKVAVERAGAYFRQRRGLDFRCVRLPMVLSPLAPPSAVSAYASRAFVQARSGERFVFPVSPETGISTIYVKDVVQGFVQLLEAPREALSQYVYNLHAFGPSAKEIAEAIRRRVPEFEYEFRPDEQVDALLSGWPKVHDDAAARRDWGWNPQYNLVAMAEDWLGG